MNAIPKLSRTFLCLLLLLLGGNIIAAPLSTAFTYQGRLNTGTNTANGFYDFRIALFDTAEMVCLGSGLWRILNQQ